MALRNNIKNFRRYLLYLCLIFLENFLNLFPLKFALKIGKYGGILAFYLLRREQRKTITNLKVVFAGMKTEQEIKSIAREVFENLGKNMVEWVRLPYLDQKQIECLVDEVEGLEYIDEALKKGKGAIVFSAHLGNWEMLAAYFGAKGYAVGVIAKKIYYERYNNFLVRLRSGNNVESIYRTEPVRKSLNFLKGNRLLGILPDQDIGEANGIFVDFFKVPAYTPKGPVLLALVSKASLIPGFIVRKPDNKHKICVNKPLELIDTGNKEEDLKVNTQKWSNEIEKFISKYPSQWVWMHQRWKTGA